MWRLPPRTPSPAWPSSSDGMPNTSSPPPPCCTTGWTSSAPPWPPPTTTMKPPLLNTIARRLALSTRTLQRRLNEHGTTWKSELDTVRRTHTTRLLHTTGLSIDAIAARSGCQTPAPYDAQYIAGTPPPPPHCAAVRPTPRTRSRVLKFPRKRVRGAEPASGRRRERSRTTPGTPQ
ncbi:helix-turn-helix domain-containing protein [Streptomyces sp. NPDC101112]|uniref:helix-turn-helix domain-containing protein n=1 Tax=Streptomyces sp. NPDC101112 TaxID=3366105 RepID=UPI00381F292B